MNDDPHEYRAFIGQFLEAYDILEKAQPLIINLFFAKAFLLGRVIELIFKIQLLQKGYQSKNFKSRETGHNLISLLKLLGFPSEYLIDKITYDSISHLNLYYSKKNYEYPGANDVEVKNVKSLESFIQLSLKKIDFHLKTDSNFKAPAV